MWQFSLKTITKFPVFFVTFPKFPGQLEQQMHQQRDGQLTDVGDTQSSQSFWDFCRQHKTVMARTQTEQVLTPSNTAAANNVL